jgi:hypothetical protein
LPIGCVAASWKPARRTPSEAETTTLEIPVTGLPAGLTRLLNVGAAPSKRRSKPIVAPPAPGSEKRYWPFSSGWSDGTVLYLLSLTCSV